MKTGLRIDRNLKLRKRLEILDQEQAEQLRAMEQLCAEFRTVFRPPRPAYLSVRNVRGCRYVEWRQGSAWGQSYIDLCGSEQGEQILSSQSYSVVQVFLNYERKRIDLSTAFRLGYYEGLTLRKHLEQLEAMAGWRKDTQKTADSST